MSSISDIAPALLFGTVLIMFYFGHLLLKVMKHSETVRENSDAYRISPTAQALYELGKPATNLTSMLKAMREELRAAGGEATQKGKEFLAESLPQLNERTDAARFLELCATYQAALNETQRRGIV